MKKIFTKKEKPNQGDNTKKKEEKDIVQSIGSYHDFLIMEKKDKINNQVLEFKNVESENNFLNDFLILQHRPKQEKSRFIDFFKEMEEKEKEKEKTEKIDEPKIEEPKIENTQVPVPNPQAQNQRFGSFERFPSYYSINIPQNNINNNNIINFGECEKKIYNNISNPNSRTPSDFGFFGHRNSYSNRSTNANTNPYYKTNSSSSLESNIINFQGGGNMNLIYTNNNNNINNIGNVNNINNKNNINSIDYIKEEDDDEKKFEPNVDIRKVLALEDKRNTIMIKNIPNKFTREKLLELINKNFKGTYDLFILPKDGNKNRNFGYAFINFLSSYSIPYFYKTFNGKKWVDTNSKKICEITYSKIQGRNELISHYPNKIIYFNDIQDIKIGNEFFIPNDYKIIFKQIFPNHPIEENSFGFITKVPFIF